MVAGVSIKRRVGKMGNVENERKLQVLEIYGTGKARKHKVAVQSYEWTEGVE